MIRMRKVLENERNIIFKIEGEITDTTLDCWNDFMQQLDGEKERQQILDFCESRLNHLQALAALIEKMTPQIFLLNCPLPIRNMLQSAGFGHSDSGLMS